MNEQKRCMILFLTAVLAAVLLFCGCGYRTVYGWEPAETGQAGEPAEAGLADTGQTTAEPMEAEPVGTNG